MLLLLNTNSAGERYSSSAANAARRRLRTYATGADGSDASPPPPILDAETADARLAAAAAAVAETLSGANPSAFEVSELDRAKSQILRFLNYKPRTRAELMTKLVEDKLYDADVAAAAIAYLQEKGVHSDVDYGRVGTFHHVIIVRQHTVQLTTAGMVHV
jgi:predicted nucleic acid-binding protein